MDRATIKLKRGFTICRGIEFYWLLHFHLRLLKSVCDIQVSSIFIISISCWNSSIILIANCYLRIRFLSELPENGTLLIFLYFILNSFFSTYLIRYTGSIILWSFKIWVYSCFMLNIGWLFSIIFYTDFLTRKKFESL